MRKKLKERIQKHTDGTIERWRDVPGHENCYRVSDKGRVKSLTRICTRGNRPFKRKGTMMTIRKLKNTDHCYVRLKGKIEYVHRLVLLAFVGPCPPGMECRHFPDRDPTNNRLENLQWGTHKENQGDMKFHGTNRQGVVRGESHGNHKVTNEMVLWIKRQLEIDVSYGRYARITRRASRKFGIKISGYIVGRIGRGTHWKHLQV